jgi:ABC-type phosphate/phosphonate transport system substrate-binding protein
LGALTDIKGKAVAMANPQSLVALRAIQELRRVGLEQGRDFRVELTRNEDSLAQLLRVGDAPMAVMSMGEFRAIREDIRQTLTIHQEFARVPGFVAMAGKPMDAARRDTIAQALTGFVATEGGVRFKAATGVQEIRAIRPGELATLDAIVAPTRQGLGR